MNKDPRRGAGHENMLTRLELDDAADRLLAAKGYDHDSVPPEGEVVYLRKTANLSTGGTAIDVTDVIHPDNKLMAERAIRAVGLDIGGVDFLTTDITQELPRHRRRDLRDQRRPGHARCTSPRPRARGATSAGR